MKIRQLELKNVTTHTATTIDFPDRGLVLITGRNGSGKSSIAEAVAWGAYGKTLRGTKLWRGEAKVEPCMVVITADECKVMRCRKGAKTELGWQTPDGDRVEYETASKAQDALTAVIGPFDLWRRSHVFSATDAAHFTLATDAERKRLIESFLGNDRFDPALEACRADLRTAAASLHQANSQHGILTERITNARQRLTETKKALALAGKEEPPAAPAKKAGKPLAHFDTLIADATREEQVLRGQLRTADAAGAEHAALAKAARLTLARLKDDVCPTCTQSIPDRLRDELGLEAMTAEEVARAERVGTAARVAEAEAALGELAEEVGALRHRRTERARELAEEAARARTVTDLAKQRAGLESTLQRAGEDLDQATEALTACQEQLESSTQMVAELSEVERVLGVKGVRAHILGRSLGGIEAVANVWLSRLHPNLRIGLRAYAELKKGGTDDSISVDVIGAGDGAGYQASSGGERRRIDIALLLGLAEVASAARGQAGGTMFLDEVFESLDREGGQACADALDHLSKTRCVVLITHNQELQESLRPVMHYRVTDGKVERVS